MSGSRLSVLKQMAKGLAAQFGSNCEVVIHDLAKNHIDNSIVYIENGHVTNRKVGGGPSAIVLDAIQHHSERFSDRLAYLTRTDKGRILKSSTIFVRDDDENETLRYVFSINFDITNLLAFESAISSLTSSQAEEEEKACGPKRITLDVNDLLEELIQQSVELVGTPVPLMTKEDKIKAIKFLNDAGAFLITRSGEKVSNFFGISKYTLYSYVDINK